MDISVCLSYLTEIHIKDWCIITACIVYTVFNKKDLNNSVEVK